MDIINAIICVLHIVSPLLHVGTHLNLLGPLGGTLHFEAIRETPRWVIAKYIH